MARQEGGAGHVGLHRRRVLPRLLECADLFRTRVAQRLQLVGPGDQRAPLRIQVAGVFRQRHRRPAPAQPLGDLFEILTDPFDV